MDNSFEDVNRVRCFNHTMQLSARALLKPFNMVARQDEDSTSSGEEVVNVDAEFDDMDISDDTTDEEEDEVEDEDAVDDDCEEEDDPFDALDEESRNKLLEDTATVRTTLSKVRVDNVFVESLLILLSRFESYRLQLCIPQPSLYRLGGQFVLSMHCVLV